MNCIEVRGLNCIFNFQRLRFQITISLQVLCLKEKEISSIKRFNFSRSISKSGHQFKETDLTNELKSLFRRLASEGSSSFFMFSLCFLSFFFLFLCFLSFFMFSFFLYVLFIFLFRSFVHLVSFAKFFLLVFVIFFPSLSTYLVCH